MEYGVTADTRQWTVKHLDAANVSRFALTPPQGEEPLQPDVNVRGPGKKPWFVKSKHLNWK